MTQKVKCTRCIGLADTQLRIKNVSEMISQYESRRYDTKFLQDGLFDLYNMREDLIIADCNCLELEQGTLPISNTGVKISAFSAGIAQKAIK